MQSIISISNDYGTIFDNIIEYGVKKFQDIKSEALILGVSGGIDSALIAALAQEINNRLDTKFNLIGRTLKITGNKHDEIDRAKRIGEAFCNYFETVNLTTTYRTLVLSMLPELFINKETFNRQKGGIFSSEYRKIRLGNIKARLRMIYLYDLARKNNGIVLSTDNLTEFLLGFWTLHGDVGDIGLIQNLWKTEVYGLSKYLISKYIGIASKLPLMLSEKYENRAIALIKCVNATPTDGLGITNSDLDQLGAETYEEVDRLLIAYLNASSDTEKEIIAKNNPVVYRHIKTEFKRNNPENIPRESLFQKRV